MPADRDPHDPFDALRAPVVRVRPRRAFAASLRRRLAESLGVDPMTGDTMTTTTTGTTGTATAVHVTPYLIVADSQAAIRWYGEAFGAVVTYPPIVMDDGRVGHCELRIGDTTLQMADAFPEFGAVAPSGEGGSVSFTVEVDDCDGAYARALSLGAESVKEPTDEFYGARAAGVRDPFGHRWSIHAPLPEGAELPPPPPMQQQ